MRQQFTQLFATLAMIAAVALTGAGTAYAAPGDVLFVDGFERASLAPWTTNNTNRSGIATGAQVSNGGTRGAFTRYDPVTVTSPTFSTAVPAAELSVWVRRGSDAFSEYPDPGEDLLIEFRRADGTWGVLARYPGGGAEGQIFNDVLRLPPDGLHGSFALRLRQTGGSGAPFDFYHIDDVRITERAPATNELMVGSCDQFELGLATNWTVVSAGGSAGTSTVTSQSPVSSLFLNGAPVTVSSNAIDTSSASFDALTLWVRRGADAFSENPDGNENLVVEYLDSASSWVLLESFAGGGTPGQIFVRNYSIPPAGRHPGFRVRFRLVDGSGSSFDFWHVDDVCLTERDVPTLAFAKVVSIVSDPINGTSNPLAIPGAFAQYLLTVQNAGPGIVDDGTLIVTDTLDAGTQLLIDDGGAPAFVFVDGAVASGLSFDPNTDVAFSNQPDGGPPFTYTPTPDALGVDPAVRGIRFSFSGQMAGNSGSGIPSFQIRFNVRIE